jgi:hypothetical protein
MPAKRPLGITSSSRINIEEDEKHTNTKVLMLRIVLTVETNCRGQGEQNASCREKRRQRKKDIRHIDSNV